MHPYTELPEHITQQRIRNRMMEYFDFVACPKAQEQFGADAIINYWQDWQTALINETYPDPIFTEAERQCIIEFDIAWYIVAESTPDPMPPPSILNTMPAWIQLISLAKAAVVLFKARGKLPEGSGPI